MANLEIKAVVRNPDGTEFYSESHRWSNLDDKMMGWFKGKIAHLDSFAKAAHGKKEDDANLSATLSASIDGAPLPDQVFSGVSRTALSKVEREFQKIGNELVTMGEQRAAEKAKKK